MSEFISAREFSSNMHRSSVSHSPERLFLMAVERSDISTVKSYLDNAAVLNFNINCRDSLGRNAVLIAIDNEHTDLLQLLLQYEMDLSDALLRAIDEEHLESVELIIAAQSTKTEDKNIDESRSSLISSFTPDITPIILAAHKDNYEIIKVLLDRGDRIPKPHDLRCSCQICVEAQKIDSLHHSMSRINAYKALASPCLIALSSKDPVLTAFELSWELSRLSRLENEFASEYEKLSKKCEEFATALLEQTRESSELAVLLNHNSTSVGVNDINYGDSFQTHSLTRLKLAIKYNQKSFVANPHCQQLLASFWYEGLPGFRRKPFIYKLTIISALGFMFPGLGVVYLVFPRSKIGRLMRKPFIKFICHSASYIIFLALLILAALRIEFTNSEVMESRQNPPTAIECLLVVYICGFIWQEIKELWIAGVKCYIMDMWNLLDFATNALYVATISLRAVAYYKFNNVENLLQEQRPKWDSYDPILISECLFSAANIFSTLKLVSIFTMNPHLGPLQISLGRMLNDILKFFCVYMLVLIAFACGLNQLLWFYAKKRRDICAKSSHRFFQPSEKEPVSDLYNYCATRGKYFTNLFEIVQSLYWSTYGLVDLTYLNLEYPHEFTEFVGKLMFGVYSVITLVVLLNMLIAMMNTSYQIIVEKADIEWKFARSKLWISYFEDGNTLPVPFNIIISPKAIYYFLRWIHLNWFCKSKGRKSKWQSIKKIVTKVNEMEQRYQKVMENLVMRYLMLRQKKEDKQEVTEDDINEIKGDISAFRYELLDILKSNGMDIPKLVPKEPKSKRKSTKRSSYKFSRQFNSFESNSLFESPLSTDVKNNIVKSENKIVDSNTLLNSDSDKTNHSPNLSNFNSSSMFPKKVKPRKSFSLDEQHSVSFDLNPRIIESYHSSVKQKPSSFINKIASKSVLKSPNNDNLSDYSEKETNIYNKSFKTSQGENKILIIPDYNLGIQPQSSFYHSDSSFAVAGNERPFKRSDFV